MPQRFIGLGLSLKHEAMSDNERPRIRSTAETLPPYLLPTERSLRLQFVGGQEEDLRILRTQHLFGTFKTASRGCSPILPGRGQRRAAQTHCTMEASRWASSCRGAGPTASGEKPAMLLRLFRCATIRPPVTRYHGVRECDLLLAATFKQPCPRQGHDVWHANEYVNLRLLITVPGRGRRRGEHPTGALPEDTKKADVENGSRGDYTKIAAASLANCKSKTDEAIDACDTDDDEHDNDVDDNGCLVSVL